MKHSKKTSPSKQPSIPNTIKNFGKMLRYKRGHLSPGEALFIEKYIADVPDMHRDVPGNYYISIAHPDGTPSTTAFSCHLDTVHFGGNGFYVRPQNGSDEDAMLQTIGYDDKCQTFFVNDPNSNCLGADDTAGIFLLLRMIRQEIQGLYLFHRGEEKGGIGSKDIANNNRELLEGIERVIAFDRKDDRSVITHQRGRQCCSNEFALALGAQLGSRWFPDSTGTFTDSANYMDFIPECTNLSVGYRNQHTQNEIQCIKPLLALLDVVPQVKWDELPVKRDPSPPKIYSLPTKSVSKPVQETIFDYEDLTPEWIKSHPDSVCLYLNEILGLATVGEMMTELDDYFNQADEDELSRFQWEYQH